MHPLDNAIWRALTTTQSRFAQVYNLARKFPPEVSLLGAFSEPTREGYDSLASLLAPGERVGLFLETLPDPPAGWNVVNVIPLLQMVCENDSKLSPETGPGALEIVRLTEKDVLEMLALTKLTK